jgi:hypothetical protein
MTLRPLILLPVLWVCASCASKDSGSSNASAAYKPLSQRLEENNGYTQDSAGNWVPRKDKRSSYDTQAASPYFKGEYNKQAYKSGEYAKKSWWGNKDYNPRSYAGKTDGSRFRNAARQQGQDAREAGGAAELPGTYQTGRHATSTAREAGTDRLSKPSDAETDLRREVFPQPAMIDWRAQRSLTLDQSRGILGR